MNAAKRLVAPFCLLAIVLAGCQRARPELVVFNWDSYFGANVKAAFERSSGTRIAEKNYGSNEELETLLNGERADVVFPSTFMVQRLQQKGKLGKLDWSRLQNREAVPPEFRNRTEATSCIPYTWSGIAMFWERGRVPEPVDLKSVFDASRREPIAGHIMALDDRRGLIGLALRHLGYSVNTKNQSELDAAVKLLIDLKRDVLFFAGGLLVDRIKETPAAWIGLSWSGDARAAALERPNLEVSIPDGSIAYVDWACITADAPPEASAFLDHLLDPLSAADLAATTRFAPVNVRAIDHVAQDVRPIVQEFMDGRKRLPSEMVDYVGDDGEKMYDLAWLRIKQ